MITVLEKPIPFGGGVVLPPNKAMSLDAPLENIAIPDRLILPLRQHIGVGAKPLVKPGDSVLKGQLIARPSGFISAPIHAPTSGTVIYIVEYEIPSPSRVVAPCIVIEPDGKEQWHEQARHGVTDYHQVSPVEIQRRIMQAGIVGLGGAGFPSAVKLVPGLNLDIELLIINAAECDPYISCDEAVIRHYIDELITGIDILAHTLQVDACVIAIEENKSEAITILEQALQQHADKGIQLKLLSSLYPAGGERQVIKSITGVSVPADGLPVDIGVVCYNVGTAFAVKQAIVDGQPLLSRVVTVTGPGINSPCNRKVLLGTPMSHVIQACGGYSESFDYLIMGGPMMGMRLENDAVPIIKTSNCLLATSVNQFADKLPEMPCIRCDECAVVCPVDLQPQQLHWHNKSFNSRKLQEFRLFDCIECGCCSYVCPSHIPLVEQYRIAKSTIHEERRKQLEAEQSKKRYLQKLERDKKRKDEKRARPKHTDKKNIADQQQQQKKDAIAAAVQRVRAKRQSKNQDS